jgi:hypothetical protein
VSTKNFPASAAIVTPSEVDLEVTTAINPVRAELGGEPQTVAPLITAGMGGTQDENIALEGVRRGVAALTGLETVAALRQSLGS